MEGGFKNILGNVYELKTLSWSPDRVLLSQPLGPGACFLRSLLFL